MPSRARAGRVRLELQRFILTVEGPSLHDVDEIELLRLPEEDEPIETRFGTAVVTRVEPNDDGSPFAGRIVCRLP